MYSIPEIYVNELKDYREQVTKALNNKIDPVIFKVNRVVHGIYEQRNRGNYMVRIRCAGGIITPAQFLFVSNLAKSTGSPYLHITTRQEVQLHNVQLEDTPDILEKLYTMGLSTKGSGGNTVRNITASVESGIAANEVFDVTPYNIALTNFLISKNVSFDMPRKFKIAFSCSGKDSALASFNDLGFIAKIQDGKKGFKVFIGGAPTVKPMVGHVLFDFLPAEDIFGVAMASIELFNRFGNRKNRHKARLRYVFYKYGKEKVFRYFQEIYNQYRNLKIDRLPVFPDNQPVNHGLLPEHSNGKDFEIWKTRYTEKQLQKDYYSVIIPVMHGNIPANSSYQLAEFAANFGNDTIRFSRRQNIHFRNIPGEYLGNLYRLLQNTGIEVDKPYILGNLVSCTGADTCQLGICFSKGSLQAIHDRLSKNEDLDSLKHLNINISGCPNSCGQQLVADLGFAGRVSRKGRIYPSYTVYAGAVVNENNSVLPDQLGEIAAKDMPEFTSDILKLYTEKAKGKSFREFALHEQNSIKSLFEKYNDIPSYEEDKTYYIDWGNNELFSLEALGGGECSAGLLDMIESEINSIKKCKETLVSQRGVEEQTVFLNEIVLAASKLLCLTVQKQIVSEQEIYNNILENFIGNQKFQSEFAPLIHATAEGNFVNLIRQKELALNYADASISYYQSLDESLQPKHTVNEITVKELKHLLDTHADIGFVDVREAWEKEIADIGGDLIPLNTIEQNLEKIPRNRTTVIYCRTGRRSAEAIALLSNQYGYENLYNLKGGIYAWADEIDSTVQKY